MITERFISRKNKLEKIFQKKSIISTWRNIVKDQIRKFDIKDIFDYYDFNYNIEERAEGIRNEILEGNYKSKNILVYKLERKLGICRHMIIPQPSDALIIQVITDSMVEEVLKSQPSPKAYYSRDRSSIKLPHQTADQYTDWKQQWKKFQKEIYDFTEEKEFIVVTDITNYFDSIRIREIRNILASTIQVDEILLDLLFRIVEDISWKPDYLPYSGQGLPTANIEGIRLLAHVLLFEIDSILDNRTNKSFVRWMDDITFGVNSKNEATSILSDLSEVLKSRGLALNLAKTKIFDPAMAEYHFQIEKNKYLDLVKDKDNRIARKEIKRKFREHLKDQNPKAWDKITKRFLTKLSSLKDRSVMKNLIKIYDENPTIRPNIIFYFYGLGYSKETAKVILDLLRTHNRYDDISLFNIVELVTRWKIPVSPDSKIFLKEIEQRLFAIKSNIDFYCLIWFKSKYNHPEELLFFIKKFSNKWQKDSFLRRQVTSVLARLYLSEKYQVTSLLEQQLSSGILDTTSVANMILRFKDIKSLDQRLSAYLFPQKKKSDYELSRFLVLCSVLNSEDIRRNKDITKNIFNFVNDPFYLSWLYITYNISK